MPDDTERLVTALADRYRIGRLLGEGGMATVHLAHDVKHDRNVAIKVFRPELAAVLGAERFLQEIKTTANLQHPNILPLFDSGEECGFLFYVMPYIPGETLRDRLDREKQLGIEEAVRIATEAAEALDFAHRQDVIHRDIKPENILLHDGRPLVADFGIALAVSAAAGGRMTETGLSLGTPHYMSPEQATAERDISPRSDIYSLGTVLYEMLTGDPPHLGSTAQQVIARIVADEPRPVAQLRRTVPPNVAFAVAKALEKLPADRFRSAGEFAQALAQPGFQYGMTVAKGDVSSWKRLTIAATAVAVVSLGTTVWAFSKDTTDVRDIGLPHDAPMQMRVHRNFSVAPDGSFLVYEASVGVTTQLWYRSLTGQEVRPIPGTEGAFGTPRISPGGSRVAFASARELKVAPIAGGPVVTVAEVQDPSGGGWLDNGIVFFSDDDGRYLRWIDPETGPARQIDVRYCLQAQLIADGERVLCSGGASKGASVKFPDRPAERRYLRRAGRDEETGFNTIRGSDFRVVDEDYLVYLSMDGALMGTRIEDHDSLTVGRPTSLVPSIRRETYSGAGQFDLTRDGTLVYVQGLNAEVGRLVQMNRDGRAEAMPVEAAAHLRFSLSPDGRRLATASERVEGQQLRVYELVSETVQMLDEAYKIGQPRWSRDGDHLVYQRWENESSESLVRLSLHTAAGPEVLLHGNPALDLWPASYPANDLLLLGSGGPQWPTLVMDPTSTPPTLDSLDLHSLFVSLSEDRRWFAYQSTGGTEGVYIQPWPDRDRRYLVDQEGVDPRWTSRTELTYWMSLTTESGATWSGAAFYRVEIDPSAEPPVRARELVFTDPRFADTPGQSYDVTPAGDLIYLQSPSENLGYYFRIVPGWVEEMKRAVDAANR